MINIAIFASGTGTNAVNIVNYFLNSKRVNIKAIFCNNPYAGILNREFPNSINKVVFTKEELKSENGIIRQLHDMDIDFIILSGFLLLIPYFIVERFSKRIINIHPSLLPKFGGKGMYGMNVHKAVYDAGETVTGITIHTIDSQYDKGEILFQAECQIDKSDSPDTIAEKVHQLEYKHFPKVIERYITQQI